MTHLSVNINKIATLRNTRPGLNIPDIPRLAQICLDAGAAGLTVHPRPDQRHIKAADVYAIGDLLKQYPDAEFNIEGNPFFDFVRYAEEVRPAQCTLVPDSPEAKTSDHGWDLSSKTDKLFDLIARIKSFGCRVSLFMDAGSPNIKKAAAIGADRIELYTEPYAARFEKSQASPAVDYRVSALEAKDLGLGVNAGHDLNLKNLGPFLASVPNVLEVSIGHALIGDALEFGLAATVKKYLQVIAAASPATER